MGQNLSVKVHPHAFDEEASDSSMNMSSIKISGGEDTPISCPVYGSTLLRSTLALASESASAQGVIKDTRCYEDESAPESATTLAENAIDLPLYPTLQEHPKEPLRPRTSLKKPKSLRIYVGTWNMNGKIPSRGVCPFPGLAEKEITSGGYHIVAIGTQECRRLDRINLSAEYLWRLRLTSMLGRQYSLLKTKRMGAMHLALFIKRSLRHKVTGIFSVKIPTGIGRIMGNKGAVVIGLRLQDMKLLFINSHLAAHHGRVRRRNKNYRKIIDELQSRGVCIGEDKVSMPPDCVFWFGDLNYRINGTRPLVEALIDQNRFEVLQSNDQLRLEMKKGNAFIGFTEAPVRFPPTYKFDTSDHSNPCRYDTSKKSRIPSWTDRILVKLSSVSDLSHDAVPSLRCGAMEVEAYDSHHGMNFSDHKPVYGIYRIAVNQDVD